MRTVAMVATTTACEHPEMLAARLRMLAEAGWRASLICRGERWRRAKALGDPALAGSVTHIGESRPGRDQRRLERVLTRMRPDVIHFHSAGAAAKALGLRQKLGCAVAVSLRPDGADLRPVPDEALWRDADLFLLEDTALLERAAWRGCPRDRSEILAAPALGPAGAPAPATSTAERPLRAVAAGPLIWERGLEHAIHGVRLALDRGTPCRLRVLGGGEHLAAVAFARHEMGLEAEVELATESCGGSLIEALRDADVLIDPAVTDTTSPGPLLAAQAMGVPYVATARDCLAEGAGHLVPPRDPSAIAAALTALARAPRLRARMGAAGRDAAGPVVTGALAADHARLRERYAQALDARRCG